jgi:hypothetical protein
MLWDEESDDADLHRTAGGLVAGFSPPLDVQPSVESTPHSSELVFHIIGGINVDCDSAECDGYPSLGSYLAIVGTSLAIGVNPAASALLGLLPSLLKKLNLQTKYRLDVNVLVIAGNADALHVTSSTGTRSFAWDTHTAIRRPDVGELRTTVKGDESDRWKDSALGLSQISLEVTRERGVFRPDTAMHFLQWDTCIVPVTRTATEYTADIHLYFRNWTDASSPYMGGLEETFLTHRDSGSAVVTAGLRLLQFVHSESTVQGAGGGRIHWLGGNASADDPAAVQCQDIKHEFEQEESGVARRRWLPSVLHTAMR